MAKFARQTMIAAVIAVSTKSVVIPMSKMPGVPPARATEVSAEDAKQIII